jgi:MFS family permease
LLDEEAGMINSMYSVGGLIGSSLYGFVCDKIGRHRALVTAAIPQVACFVLVAIADDATTILLSRLMLGLSGGGLYVAIPLFVSEITQDS